MAKNKTFFESVNSRVDFPSQEREMLSNWDKKGIVKKYLNKNNASKKRFSFLDGPITANGPMGVHHGWGRTYKDIWQRYKNMQGYKQRFQNGFDSQGLWVEVEVEKELGFKSKKDIEKYGIEKFVKKCIEKVEECSDTQTKQSERLGYFMDWDNSYFTMSDANNYMIWNFLKVCHDNGWLYKGKESVPWCPRCETAISQHEMLTEDYKEITHESIIIKFPIIDSKNEFLLVWTTTPWTIPANIAVAVDKKIDYSLVEDPSGEKYWMAEDARQRVVGKKRKVIKTVKGEELVGLKYIGAFDDLPAVKKVAKANSSFHTVIATDDRLMPVVTTEGTGMVHTAVSAGTEDFKLGKKLGLPMIPVIADDASYLKNLGFLSGKNAKDNPGLILGFMKNEGNWVFEIFNYKHRYPRCWRCKEELVWKVTDEWYIAMDKASALNKKDKRTLREKMIRVAKDITWIPEFGLKRELDWLNNMNDWLISKKNRYWGLCLPIWECTSCKHFEVVGSKEELKELAVSGWKQFEGKSPHKPQLDMVKIKCSNCGEVADRIEPVGNPWLDAGIISFSTITKDNKGEPLYLKDKKSWEEWYPADFITESFPGQFKNWFYSMLAMGTVLEDAKPYKTVMGYATLLGEDGRAMHKSWGNAVDFNEAADKIGVDVMRWIYSKQNYADNLMFGFNVGDETRRRFHLKLWNIYNFFVTYANSEGWKPKDKVSIKSDNPLDRWIMARLKSTINQVTDNLEDYNAYQSAYELEGFVDDLSNWYVRRSRDRIGVTALDNKDKEVCYSILYTILIELSKILAVFVPFMSESIYINLTKEESVHLTSWPAITKLTKQESDLIDQMGIIRGVVEKIHAERKLANIPVRQPLSSVDVVNKNEMPPQELIDIACSEVNIKKVSWKKGDKEKVVLDTKITPKLKEEEQARQLIRKIQKERKEAGVNLNERIDVVSDWLPKDSDLVSLIKQKTLANSIKPGKNFEILNTSK